MNAAGEHRTRKPQQVAPLQLGWTAAGVTWLLFLGLVGGLGAVPMTLALGVAALLVAVFALTGGLRKGLLHGVVAHIVLVLSCALLGVAAPFSQFWMLSLLLLVAAAGGVIHDLRLEVKQRDQQVQSLQEEITRLQERQGRQSRLDGLTGVHSRSHFQESFYIEHLRAVRYGEPLSVMVLNVDGLQNINTLHGPAAGDQVLQDIAHILQSCIREMDVLARYSGGEFVLLLPCTGQESALLLGNRLRQQVSGHMWAHIDPNMQVTLSGGICSDLTLGSAEAMLSEAENRMNQAREKGRNQIC